MENEVIDVASNNTSTHSIIYEVLHVYAVSYKNGDYPFSISDTLFSSTASTRRPRPAAGSTTADVCARASCLAWRRSAHHRHPAPRRASRLWFHIETSRRLPPRVVTGNISFLESKF